MDQDTEVFVVTAEEKGSRLDKLLTDRFDQKSRTYFQYLIENHFVLVNGKPVKKSIKLEERDEVDVTFQLTPELSLEPEDIPLDILFEDEHLLAIHKPAGMVVHPAPGNWSGTFVNALLAHCKRVALPEEGLRPGVVHRLDKDTSGVLLAAKTQIAQQKLVNLFQEKKIIKHYLALTLGKPPNGPLSLPIGRHPVKRKEMAIVENGKAAETLFQVIAFNDPYSLVLARPITGRTHQIRVHLKHLGSPVIGDSIYGNKERNEIAQAPRHLLHAYLLKLPHPITGEQLEIVAPLPKDFKSFIYKLGFLNQNQELQVERPLVGR